MRYRWHVGFWAFLLMRISGAAITLYLIMHLLVLNNLLGGQIVFDGLMTTMENPLFKLFELALLAGLLFHSLNGLRIIWVDFLSGVVSGAKTPHKAWFWTVIVISVLVFIIGAPPFLTFLQK